MEDFVKQMAERVGISEEQATKVIEFLREHMDEVPQLLSGDSDFFKSMSDRVQGFFGGADDTPNS